VFGSLILRRLLLELRTLFLDERGLASPEIILVLSFVRVLLNIVF